MFWFEGNIPNAIQTAKRESKILIVYITGIDDVSEKMNETWIDENVTKICKDECIALKIDAKSETCVQFSQIYPVVIVPSTYFIGNQGVPLEVVGGHVEPGDFASKVQQVVQINKGGSVNTVVRESTENMSSEEKSKNLQGSSGTVEDSQGATASSDSPKEEISSEEKVQRAQELIELRRRQKAKEEADKELNAELQRRKLGKDAIKLKQWQEEKEREETANTWKKEREEDRLHKEKVKQQIARDRAERQAKFMKQKEERQQEQEKQKEAKQAAAAKASAEAESAKRETARIQFRLPDGSSVTETFASSETLGTARIFLKAKIGNTYGNFTLNSTFPRRQFKEEDMCNSLLDLDLAPSAALIVIPGGKESPTNTSDGGSGGGVLMLILSPLILLWNFIMNLLFGTAPTQRSSSSPGPQTSDSSPSQSNTTATNSQYSSQASREEQLSAFRNRGVKSEGATSRQEGNIRRFRNIQDDDDDTSTYNGNSTQQM